MAPSYEKSFIGSWTTTCNQQLCTFLQNVVGILSFGYGYSYCDLEWTLNTHKKSSQKIPILASFCFADIFTKYLLWRQITQSKYISCSHNSFRFIKRYQTHSAIINHVTHDNLLRFLWPTHATIISLQSRQTLRSRIQPFTLPQESLTLRLSKHTTALTQAPPWAAAGR